MELNHAIWQKSSRSGDNGGDCVEVTIMEQSEK